MRSLHSPRFYLVAILLAAAAIGSTIAAERSSSTMATAATRFLGALTPEQRQQATFAFGADERMHWHFIPTEMFPRKGLTIKEMTEPQRKLAHDPPSLGREPARLPDRLVDHGSRNRARGARGCAARRRGPAADRRAARPRHRALFLLGLRDAVREGHLGLARRRASRLAAFHGRERHAGRRVAVVLRQQPRRSARGPKKGLRILGAEEDAARALLESLDASQRTKAIFDAKAPGDMLTMANVNITPLSPTGLGAESMTPAQKDLLMKLVDVYAGKMAADIAADRLARLKKAGVEKIGFAWAGETERGKKHYYRVQGPSFLIEYDNTQNDGNHIHSVWRDFDGDFGRDLLREHLKSSPH
jgi:hypothetical protein